MENRRFSSFPPVTVAGILPTLRLLSGTELLQDHVMCLKRLITAAFGSFEQFCM